MIITITSLKGGTGKSTICQNVAVELINRGFKVLVIDADKHKNTLKFSLNRVKQTGKTLNTIEVNNLYGLKQINGINDYNFVIIDGSPDVSELITACISISDLLIITAKPSLSDIWGTDDFLKMYKNTLGLGTKIKTAILLNEYNDRARIDREAKREFENYNLDVFSRTITKRNIFKEAVVNGLGVSEMKNYKAKHEINILVNELLNKYQNDK